MGQPIKSPVEGPAQRPAHDGMRSGKAAMPNRNDRLHRAGRNIFEMEKNEVFQPVWECWMTDLRVGRDDW